MADGPMLQLQGVHKRFGELEVLRGIDLEVGKGQVVCVLGPSGSGKSTLLRCINLLEPPEQGDILLEGKSICKGEDEGEEGWELDYVRQQVGMVFQQFNLFPHKNAIENVAMAQQTVLGETRTRPGPSPRACSSASGSPTSSTSTPSGYRAASSNGSRSRGRWRWTPR